MIKSMKPRRLEFTFKWIACAIDYGICKLQIFMDWVVETTNLISDAFFQSKQGNPWATHNSFIPPRFVHCNWYILWVVYWFIKKYCVFYHDRVKYSPCCRFQTAQYKLTAGNIIPCIARCRGQRTVFTVVFTVDLSPGRHAT